ncbi:DNA mismatch repair protein MutS [uncultured Eudoraea sp.]|uniref:MutS-related protein n=1 Tax=uncultured Eudoraea sp. TaxID=1035614 RepID=UPI0026270DB6|nr:DNA mismatch repair protein MutS [uncultured Eudoraea sp.]
MLNPTKFYKERIEKLNSRLVQVKRQLFFTSMLRLTVFALAVLGIYLFYENSNSILFVLLIAAIAFLILVSRHTDLNHRKRKLLALISINETELLVLDRKFYQLPEGNEFSDRAHYYCQDIDLFGKGSFYQYCNRTALGEGSAMLAGLFKENNIDNVTEKQIAIKELGALAEWRQEFSAIAQLIRTEISSDKLVNWLKGYQPFVPKIFKTIPNIFSLCSLGVIGLFYFDFISGWGLLLWVVLGLGITGKYLKRINELSQKTSQAQRNFEQYQKLIMLLEEINFKARLLENAKEDILVKGVKVSQVLKQFSGMLNAFDQRNNILFGVLANGFLLWDLRYGLAIEKWIRVHGSSVESWLNTIAFFDAFNSLGNFSFNHPGYSFPEITKNELIIEAHNLSHPMLDPSEGVRNNFKIHREEFFVITGANMAGKSTFLRTISLQIIMANIGLPVCASSLRYRPIKLITSMRTADSLTEHESYFFSELKRLKFIIDKIKEDQYFIVLDEILKGTNSTDKAIGSRKFVEKLVKSNSTGLIATHDLSLCEVADSLEKVDNYYFDAAIVNDELHFDYKIKKGICQNMNASFLLKKMDIVE